MKCGYQTRYYSKYIHIYKWKHEPISSVIVSMSQTSLEQSGE